MTYPITSENEFNQLKLEFLRLQLNQKREKFQNIQRKIDSTEDLKANEKSQLDKIMKLNLIAENRFEMTNWEIIQNSYNCAVTILVKYCEDHKELCFLTGLK